MSDTASLTREWWKKHELERPAKASDSVADLVNRVETLEADLLLFRKAVEALVLRDALGHFWYSNGQPIEESIKRDVRSALNRL